MPGRTDTAGDTGFLTRQWTAEPVLAVALCVLVGIRLTLPYNAPLGGMAGLLLLPLWLPLLRRFRLFVALAVLLVAATVSGLLLTWWLSAERVAAPSSMIERSALALCLLGAVGALLWARTIVGLSTVAIAFGAGMTLGIAGDLSGTVSWRFTFSIPLTVLALAIAARRGGFVPQFVVIVALAVIGAANGARSNTAMLFLAAVVLIWQRLGRAAGTSRRRAGNIIGVLLFGLAVFFIAQAAILEGFFGEATRERTQSQIDESGSLLLGGRPEIAASDALIRLHPLGMGSGIIASPADVTAAKSAMSSIGYDPHNNYVERFMFGGGVEVHSMLGDFWLWFGVAGLAVCITIAVIAGLGLERALRDGVCTALAVYLATRLVWDLAFSPAVSAMKTLPLALVVLAVPVAAVIARRSSPPPPSPRRAAAGEARRGI
ncbi:hypothetical protein [Microbacterium terricola]|uniref:O-antigen ligase family protein n=1 Tax=Microbacterium terricola TaxID=344163 RepID=A0ABM8DV15_9MICO|nr:hypothetical protein [Microbacterium terricola]UYK39728.1 hypothetical protein OAU46_13685 [Microbacterium terricola]BDV29524.1 hypothetical protein Microterr_01840 [Microbacterium terricola]